METRVVLIDADSIVWVTAYHNRDNENSDLVVTAIDIFLSSVFIATQATHYVGLLGGKGNFRKALFSSYKANRKDPPPWLTKWKTFITQYLITVYNFQVVDNIEADDAIASAAEILETKGIDFVICSPDKDLSQVPGQHYNPKDSILYPVTTGQALRAISMQLLTGDSTDNVKGIPGVGPVKAEKILRESKKGEFETVLESFIQFYNGDEIKGLLDFAETVVKIVLRRDINFEFKYYPVFNKLEESTIETPENQENKSS